MLTKLRDAAGGYANVQKYLAEADGHTEFIYRKGYTKNRLPTFNTHAVMKTVCQPVHKFIKCMPVQCHYWIWSNNHIGPGAILRLGLAQSSYWT